MQRGSRGSATKASDTDTVMEREPSLKDPRHSLSAVTPAAQSRTRREVPAPHRTGRRRTTTAPSRRSGSMPEDGESQDEYEEHDDIAANRREEASRVARTPAA